MTERWIGAIRVGSTIGNSKEKQCAMRSAICQTLVALIGGLFVIVALFLATTEIAHIWATPRDLNANMLRIVEATYGKNCQGFVPLRKQTNIVKPGNATVAASLFCDKTNVMCPVSANVVMIGDPAFGSDKDFTVSWRCGVDRTIHQIYLPAEVA
jgi:hypothetical protein